MASSRPATLATLARKLGLSVSSVSYALRNHPHTADSTKQRVLAAARELDYRPNAAVASLMGHIRRGRRPNEGACLGFVWVEASRAEARSDPFYRQVFGGAQERAARHGFRLEQHWLREPSMNPVRLGQVLKSRGITGLVFSPCNHNTTVTLDWAWDDFAMAVIGNAPWPVELHRAVHHHYAGMRICLERAAECGMKRCVALIEETVNSRAGRAWEAAFVTFSPPCESARERLWLGPAESIAQARAFVRRLKPDCVITSSPAFAPADAQTSPKKRGPWWMVLNRALAPAEFGGIDNDYARIAANAVDLVIGQLHRNERGIPADPKLLHFNGRWVDPRTAE
ncbi:MAG: LacI family DNA-binding transcriptional regulator [Opitutus sp.]